MSENFSTFPDIDFKICVMIYDAKIFDAENRRNSFSNKPEAYKVCSVAESVVDQEWMDGHWRGVAEGNWEISQHCQR